MRGKADEDELIMLLMRILFEAAAALVLLKIGEEFERPLEFSRSEADDDEEAAADDEDEACEWFLIIMTSTTLPLDVVLESRSLSWGKRPSETASNMQGSSALMNAFESRADVIFVVVVEVDVDFCCCCC